MKDFEIAVIRKMDGDRGLLAFCDVVFFETITVRNFRIIKSRDGRNVFCGLPLQRYYDEGTNAIKGGTTIYLPSEFKEKLYTCILDTWNRNETLKFNRNGGDEK